MLRLQRSSHWEFRRAIITGQTSTELAAADRIIERPKVIYNEATKKYVMWLHWDGASYATAEAGVLPVTPWMAITRKCGISSQRPHHGHVCGQIQGAIPASSA